MAYQIKMQDVTDAYGTFQKYRISNSSGAYVIFSQRDAAVEQVILCGNDRQELPTLFAPGRIRFFASGEELFSPAGLWTLADHGDNWLVLQMRPEGMEVHILLRYAWMDHERLVLDIAAEGPGADKLTCRTDFSFTLGGEDAGEYRLTLYGCQVPVTDENGRLCTGASGQAAPTGEGLRPVAELVCPSSDMTMTAYTTLPQLYICRQESVLLNSSSGEDACAFPQRVVYGFDPIYHGPDKVYPFAF